MTCRKLMALTECLRLLHLRVLQNTITTSSNLECLCIWMEMIFPRELMYMCWLKGVTS